MEQKVVGERRSPKFTEQLSAFMVWVAAFGAIVVLLDFKVTLTIGDAIVSIGGNFSNDLKGAVISAILISGWTAVKEYWLGASATNQAQTESITRIAEAKNGNTPPEKKGTN